MQQEIDRSYYQYNPPPTSEDLLVAIALELTKFPVDNKPTIPQNEEELARGLLAAAMKDPLTGLGRFVNEVTGQLTDVARASLKQLQEENKFTPEGSSFIIPPTMASTLRPGIEMSFTRPGTEALRQASKAAGDVWSP